MIKLSTTCKNKFKIYSNALEIYAFKNLDSFFRPLCIRYIFPYPFNVKEKYTVSFEICACHHTSVK